MSLPDGFLGGELYSLNDESWAVGYGIDPNGGQGFRDTRALRWSPQEEVQELGFLVDANGWILTRAHSINNVGQIVGRGDFHGESPGWLLTPVANTASR